jgi:hypothetical protein
MPVEENRTVLRYNMVSVLCMPVRAGDRIAALIHLESPGVGYFDDSHRALLRPLLDLAGPVLEALAAGRSMMQERDQLAESEQRLLGEAEESRQLLARDWSFGRFVGRAPAVRELESRVRRAAAAPTRCSSSARPARARASSRASCTRPARARASRSSPSSAPRASARSWRPSCSAT